VKVAVGCWLIGPWLTLAVFVLVVAILGAVWLAIYLLMDE
jgi:hypothetical protein